MNFPWICSTVSPLIYFIDLHIHLATNNRAAFPFAVKQFRDVYVGLGVHSKQMHFRHHRGSRETWSFADPGELYQERRESRHIRSDDQWDGFPEIRGTSPKLWDCSWWALGRITARGFMAHVCRTCNVPLVLERLGCIIVLPNLIFFFPYCVSIFFSCEKEMRMAEGKRAFGFSPWKKKRSLHGLGKPTGSF